MLWHLYYQLTGSSRCPPAVHPPEDTHGWVMVDMEEGDLIVLLAHDEECRVQELDEFWEIKVPANWCQLRMKEHQNLCDYIPDQKLVLSKHPILQLCRGKTSFISKLLGWKFQCCKCNDRTVLLLNFKAVDQTQAELHSLKVEKLDVYARPLFTNSVTYVHMYVH